MPEYEALAKAYSDRVRELKTRHVAPPPVQDAEVIDKVPDGESTREPGSDDA
jgi:hypothetical protein